MDETHIEHTISFIEDEKLHVFQINISLIHEVEESPRCRNEDIKSMTNGIDLWLLTDPTKDNLIIDFYILPVVREALPDLYREFSCGREDERSDISFSCWKSSIFIEELDDR
jgi:hypothetical protein